MDNGDGQMNRRIGSAAAWLMFLVITVLLLASALALIVRFRRAGPVEKQQIKWLLYGCTIFVVTYIPSLFQGGEFGGAVFDILHVLNGISSLAIPAAIAIAILRYRLFDIDLIIRRTLLYTLLTALLGMVYFGAVTLSQALFENASGERTPISIVLSTLVIAALFAPLRRRLQNIVDRRFFRSNYDAAQALAQFARFARDEVELDALSAELLQVVTDTVHPTQTGLWLKPSGQGNQAPAGSRLANVKMNARFVLETET